MTGEILVAIFISVDFVSVIYHLPPNFRIDAQRLTGTAEREKRSETSTEPLRPRSH